MDALLSAMFSNKGVTGSRVLFPTRNCSPTTTHHLISRKILQDPLETGVLMLISETRFLQDPAVGDQISSFTALSYVR